MKIMTYLTLCFSTFLSTAAFSAAEITQQNNFTITGTARLYVPIDQVELTIGAIIEGETAEKAEHKGYQLGIKLKNIFKQFKVTEKAIKKSNVSVYIDAYYTDEGKKTKGYYSSLEYTIEFKQINLIDTLRERCVKAGATNFSITQLVNNQKDVNIAKAKQMAYQNARKMAEATLKGSGLKIGLPLSISGNGQYFSGQTYFEAAGIGSAPPVRESLWQQRQIYIDERVEVKFLVE